MNIEQLPEVQDVWGIFWGATIGVLIVFIALRVLLWMNEQYGLGIILDVVLMFAIVISVVSISMNNIHQKFNIQADGYEQIQEEIFDVYGLKVSVDEVETLSEKHSDSSRLPSDVFNYLDEKHDNGVITFGTIDIAQTDEQGVKSIIPITLIKFDNEFILTYGDAEEINELPRNTQELATTETGK